MINFFITEELITLIFDLLSYNFTASEICGAIITTQGVVQSCQLDGIKISLADVQCYSQTNPTEEIKLYIPVYACSQKGKKVLAYWKLFQNIIFCALKQASEYSCTLLTSDQISSNITLLRKMIFKQCGC